MDMKRILQAFDSASTKPVEGASDMAKFLRVVSEAEINQPASPTPPPMPSIDGLQVGQTKEVNPGEKVTLKADGTVSHEGWWGEQIFNTNGQLVKTIGPRFNGYQQQTDSTGKIISKTQSITNPDGQEMGSVTQNADGTQSSNVDLGTTVLSQQRDANGNLANGTATVRGETPAQNQTVTMEDVKRLAGIITEGANPHKVALPVQMAMQHYQQPKTVAPKKASLLKQYFAEAEQAVQEEEQERKALIKQYASVIAERVLVKESTETNLEETPIDMTGDPNDPVIYGHEKANPMSLKGRIQQTRAQLRELAQAAESNDLAVWQDICAKAKGGLFMGLEQNLEQVRHGIAELAAKRKKGGVASRGIDKNISERSVSQAQAHLMAAAAHNPEFAKKVKMKQSVAKEFNKADKGKNIKSLPVRVPKKK